MSPPSAVVSPDKISEAQFNESLGKYAPLIKAISDAKPAKNGQKTLVELDHYRYVDAVRVFSSSKPSAELMDLDDVKKLVSWKLSHGKFRPTLMKLVSSNDPSSAKDVIEKAIKTYRDKSDISEALDALCKLRGIGPATASLLLSVHDPENALFFSDEAFWWLCCDGKKDAIKYNAKEYKALNLKAKELMNRLGVKATDVEKVAYVLMKQDSGVPASSSKSGNATRKSVPKTKPEPEEKKPQSKLQSKPQPKPKPKPGKRKQISSDDAVPEGVRRSKRVKSA